MSFQEMLIKQNNILQITFDLYKNMDKKTIEKSAIYGNISLFFLKTPTKIEICKFIESTLEQHGHELNESDKQIIKSFNLEIRKSMQNKSSQSSSATSIASKFSQLTKAIQEYNTFFQDKENESHPL